MIRPRSDHFLEYAVLQYKSCLIVFYDIFHDKYLHFRLLPRPGAVSSRFLLSVILLSLIHQSLAEASFSWLWGGRTV